MINTPTVEVIDVIRNHARKDLPDSDKCKELLEAKNGKRLFAHSIQLALEADGTWRVSFFTDDADNHDYITLHVRPNGKVSVERLISQDGMTDNRRVHF